VTVPPRVLCALSDIAEPGSRGFTLDTQEGPLEIFVVRAGGGIYGYVNVCPHAGTPLDWKPDEFLTADRSLIQCATHGALFTIATGKCVRGPCRGAQLESVPLYTKNDKILIGATT
jgi:nitrite reductase/ring-hydroxylating ferredoxin subunit